MDSIDLLLTACCDGNLKEVKRLIESGVDVNCKGVPGWDIYQSIHSPLEIASMFGNTEIVKYLVAKGADVTTDDNFPVRIAVTEGYTDIVKYLAQNGADLSTVGFKELRDTVSWGNADTVKYLLNKGVVATSWLDFLIEDACVSNYLEILKCLVEFGADITIKNHVAFRKAIERGHFEIIKHLLNIDVSLFGRLMVVGCVVIYEGSGNWSVYDKGLSNFLSTLLSIMKKKYMLSIMLNGKKTMCKDLLSLTVDARYKKHYC